MSLLVDDDVVQFLNGLLRPAADLVANEMHVLLAVVDDLKLTARLINLNLDVLHLLTLSVLGRLTDVVFVGDAESVQLLLFLVVEASELVHGLFVLADGAE